MPLFEKYALLQVFALGLYIQKNRYDFIKIPHREVVFLPNIAV